MPPYEVLAMLILSRKFSEQERWLPRPRRGTSSWRPWGQCGSACQLPQKTGGAIGGDLMEVICVVDVKGHWFKSKLEACTSFGPASWFQYLCLRIMYLGSWINMLIFGRGRKKKRNSLLQTEVIPWPNKCPVQFKALIGVLKWRGMIPLSSNYHNK